MLNHHCENLVQQIDEYKTIINEKGGQKQKGGQKRWSEMSRQAEVPLAVVDQAILFHFGEFLGEGCALDV